MYFAMAAFRVGRWCETTGAACAARKEPFWAGPSRKSRATSVIPFNVHDAKFTKKTGVQNGVPFRALHHQSHAQ